MAVTLHVALDPRDPAPADVAIVVDCIRATTTISHALDTGYASVTCVGEIDDAHAERAEGVLLGGERHGVMIEGFDLGNSPAEYAVQRGERIVLTTTNGTRAILQAVAESTTVLVGALVNAQALAACSGPIARSCRTSTSSWRAAARTKRRCSRTRTPARASWRLTSASHRSTTTASSRTDTRSTTSNCGFCRSRRPRRSTATST
jgi:hypothetical protein